MGARALVAEAHRPLWVPAEGLALLSPWPQSEHRSLALDNNWRWWSSKRRIGVRATIRLDAGPVPVYNTHLAAGIGNVRQLPQIARLLELVDDRSRAVLAGDLNAIPDSASLRRFDECGLRDAAPADSRATNWERNERSGPPTQRLDYILVGGAVHVLEVTTPTIEDPNAVSAWRELSDHLPVTARLRLDA